MWFNKIIIFYILAGISISGCGLTKAQSPENTPTLPANQATPTVIIPTPTSEPLAASVNGRGIPLDLYKSQLQQFNEAASSSGISFTPEEASKMVLDNMIDHTLLVIEGEKAGHAIDDPAIQIKIEELKKSLGNKTTLQDWQKRNGYDDNSLKESLIISMMAAWERDQIINKVPDTAEQVNGRQILVLDKNLADKIYSQLQAGGDFETLATQYDPQLGGNLGWFPRGYLTIPELEEAAFILQPGQFSPVIKTAFGFQIIQVIERDPQRKLAPDARKAIQRKTIQEWMDEARSKSKIEIFVKGG